jgi:hypothetical protein
MLAPSVGSFRSVIRSLRPTRGLLDPLRPVPLRQCFPSPARRELSPSPILSDTAAPLFYKCPALSRVSPTFSALLTYSSSHNHLMLPQQHLQPHSTMPPYHTPHVTPHILGSGSHYFDDAGNTCMSFIRRRYAADANRACPPIAHTTFQRCDQSSERTSSTFRRPASTCRRSISVAMPL